LQFIYNRKIKTSHCHLGNTWIVALKVILIKEISNTIVPFTANMDGWDIIQSV